MDGNAELLNFIYQNSSMGITTIEQILGITNDARFKEHLESELMEYTAIHNKAKELLHENGCTEKELGMLEKLKTYLMISAQTINDKSVSHTAEMMIIGSNMGVIDAIKSLKKYRNSESGVFNLMERLLRFEEQNVQRLKDFL